MRSEETKQPHLILASRSPRRAELLARMGLQFVIDAADVPEDDAIGTPEEQVCMLARRKAEAVAHRHPNAWVLGADTLVYCDRVLGKPSGTEEAVAMLSHLSNRWHSVHSGICLMDTNTGRTSLRHVMTRVHFLPLSGADILDYVADGESLDKAGAYGVQGRAGMFIDRIEGCHNNVMGLPIAQLRLLMLEMGWR
ncbi:MAG TPA: Maf family protein [Clostridia bacterium]|nr:Maf family protein [Clostridia bacterium]